MLCVVCILLLILSEFLVLLHVVFDCSYYSWFRTASMTGFFHDLFGLVYVGNTKMNHDVSRVPEIKLIMSLNYYDMLVITSFKRIIIDTAVLDLTLPTFAALKSLKVMELFSYDPCDCEFLSSDVVHGFFCVSLFFDVISAV